MFRGISAHLIQKGSLKMQNPIKIKGKNMYEQGSPEWHDFRKKGLGSSDAAAALGVSPWKTPYQLWSEKTSEVDQENKPNSAMKKGIKLEPQIRAWSEKELGVNLNPECRMHPKYDFLRASLDGISKDEKTVVEMKYVGIEDFFLARDMKKIPGKYIPQLAHQAIVCVVPEVRYVCYNDEINQYAILRYSPTKEYKDMLLKAEIEFWDKVTSNTPPEITDKDIVPQEIHDLIQWKNVKQVLDDIKLQEAELREKIIGQMKYNSIRSNGVVITKITKKGSIDYNRIPDLEDMDLELYRKPSSSYHKFTVQKDKDEVEI